MCVSTWYLMCNICMDLNINIHTYIQYMHNVNKMYRYIFSTESFVLVFMLKVTWCKIDTLTHWYRTPI